MTKQRQHETLYWSEYAKKYGKERLRKQVNELFGAEKKRAQLALKYAKEDRRN